MAEGADLITSITFPTSTQLFPQMSNSGFYIGTRTSLVATRGLFIRADKHRKTKEGLMFNSTRLSIIKGEWNTLLSVYKPAMIRVWDGCPSCSAYGSSVCVCVCPYRLGAICLSASCPLICCQGPAALALPTSYSLSPYSVLPSASSNALLQTGLWKIGKCLLIWSTCSKMKGLKGPNGVFYEIFTI